MDVVDLPLAQIIPYARNPRLPVGGASHCVSGSNQIDREPRLARAAL